MKRAAIYTRVSTDEQAEKGYSLQSQLEACRRYAREHGFNIVAEYRDDFSGAKLDRPDFSKLRESVSRNEIDVVIVYCADRLTRNLAHSLILREEFERAGVERHTVMRGATSNNAESRMIENIEGVFAEYEREKIRERSNRGMVSKAKNGRVVGQGHAPYGYLHVNGSFQIHPTESEVVKNIFQWFVLGDESTRNLPIGTMAIARKLSELKVPTPAQKWEGWAHRRKRPLGVWGFTSVRRILTNETYAGIWHYRKRKGAGGSQGERAPNEWIAVQVQPLISREVWESAQRQLLENKRLSARNSRREYLLRGLVRCGSCNRMLTGCPPHSNRTSENWSHYYRCTARVRQHKSAGEIVCLQKDVNGHKLEKVVWDYILELMTDPDRLEQGLREAQRQEQKARQPRADRLQLVAKLIQEIESEATHLANSLKDVNQGGVVANALNRRSEELDHQYAALLKEQIELQEQLSTPALTDEEITQIHRYRKSFNRGIENPTFEDKRKVLLMLRVQIWATRQWVKIQCCLPVGEMKIDVSTSRSDCRCR